MKLFFATAVAAVIAPSVFAAEAMTGKITAAPSIVLEGDNSKYELKLSGDLSKIYLWDGHKTATLFTVQGESEHVSKCGKYLGNLTQPLVLKALMADGKQATILVPARGASVFQSCGRSDLPSVLQIDLKDRSKVITVDTDGSKIKATLAELERENKAVEKAISEFEKRVKSSDHEQARKAYSAARRLILTGAELRRIADLRERMSLEERPIDSKNLSSRVVDVSQLLGRDVGAMTTPEFIEASYAYLSSFRNEKSEHSISYIFELMDAIEAPKAAKVKLLSQTIDVNVDGIIVYARAGGGRAGLSFTPQILLSDALVYMSIALTAEEMTAYFAGVKAKVQTAMAADPNVAAVLSRMYWGAREFDPTK